MQARLKTLYELQLIDDQLDVLEELRGDLPNAVYELQGKINGLKAQIDQKELEQKNSAKKLLTTKKKRKIKKQPKKIQNPVVSGKEQQGKYDALTKE